MLRLSDLTFKDKEYTWRLLVRNSALTVRSSLGQIQAWCFLFRSMKEREKKIQEKRLSWHICGEPKGEPVRN